MRSLRTRITRSGRLRPGHRRPGGWPRRWPEGVRRRRSRRRDSAPPPRPATAMQSARARRRACRKTPPRCQPGDRASEGRCWHRRVILDVSKAATRQNLSTRTAAVCRPHTLSAARQAGPKEWGGGRGVPSRLDGPVQARLAARRQMPRRRADRRPAGQDGKSAAAAAAGPGLVEQHEVLLRNDRGVEWGLRGWDSDRRQHVLLRDQHRSPPPGPDSTRCRRLLHGGKAPRRPAHGARGGLEDGGWCGRGRARARAAACCGDQAQVAVCHGVVPAPCQRNRTASAT